VGSARAFGSPPGLLPWRRVARRVFSEDLSDLPLTPLPDWELIARIEQLFREHIPAWGRVRFAAMDSRGSYETDDLESFRREVQAQEELPKSIQLTASQTEPDGNQRLLNAYMSPTYLGSGGRVTSTDEAVVHHVAQPSASSTRNPRRVYPPRPPSETRIDRPPRRRTARCAGSVTTLGRSRSAARCSRRASSRP
jgi:hypothetical protein